jgi:hypothetical protein
MGNESFAFICIVLSFWDTLLSSRTPEKMDLHPGNKLCKGCESVFSITPMLLGPRHNLKKVKQEGLL